MKNVLFALAIFALVVSGFAQTEAPSVDLSKSVWKSFSKPDEVRDFPLGKLELVNVGGIMIGRATFQPGWRWSTSLKPLVMTETCEAPHFQYHVSGTLKVQMTDGTTYECKPGDVSWLPAGHDAWVEGDEPVVVVDWNGMVDYAHSKK